MNQFTRRHFMKMAAATAAVSASSRWGSAFGQVAPPNPPRTIALGPCKATWESLVSNYQTPDWYRDAKFGMWAHWTAQCVAEQGDWYARRMYIQGERDYDYHVKTYGHPSKFGFMEIDNLWKAEKWDPQRLIGLYKRAGAKYFFGLANHHDNFDMYDSAHHAWNSVNVGPKKDIIGVWAKVVREAGLKFGVTNHASWANRWLQPAYGYDAEGPLAGVRYDAYTLTKEDGKGKWWEGLDPQELYTGNVVKIPDGIKTIADMQKWINANTSLAKSNPMPSDAYCENWYQRCKDLVEKYQPDVLYFDTNELPLGQAGLDVVAHYYNLSAARNGGRPDVVVNGKHILPEHVGAFVEDIERSTANAIRPDAWQTDTCIGDWHYSRAVADEGRYQTVATIVGMMTDIVSKNGNLMLNIPLRGDGTIDEHEEAFIAGLTAWMDVNSEGIYATRPWKIYGEGPSTARGGGRGAGRGPATRGGVARGGGRGAAPAYTAEDVRFTTKGDALYAFVGAWPESRVARIKSLGTGSPQVAGAKVQAVKLLGYDGPLTYTQDEQGLAVNLPEKAPSEHAVTLKIQGILTA
jgi:alpha-L-fucosidase